MDADIEALQREVQKLYQAAGSLTDASDFMDLEKVLKNAKQSTWMTRHLIAKKHFKIKNYKQALDICNEIIVRDKFNQLAHKLLEDIYTADPKLRPIAGLPG